MNVSFRVVILSRHLTPRILVECYRGLIEDIRSVERENR